MADATVPVSNGPHAFLLTPGHPSMQAALESDDPAAYLAAKRAVDQQAAQGQRDTPLTPALREAMLEEIVPQGWTDRDGWKAKFAA